MARKPRTGGSDVSQLQELLLWARRERIVLSSAAVGGAHVTVHDLGLIGDAPKSDDELRRGIYEQFGGKALADLEAETNEAASAETLLDEDDDLPAITDTGGRRKR